MRKIFIKDNLLCKDDNCFTYDMYMDACKKIAENIKKKYDLSDPSLGFIGIARGGLPLLVTVSQLLEFRHVSFIQCKMTNSDQPYDYGDFSIISEYIEPGKTKFIVFDDILYSGKTSYGVIDYLNKKNIKVEDVYALVADKSFQNDNPDITFQAGFESKKDSWVHFFWVEDVRELARKRDEENDKKN